MARKVRRHDQHAPKHTPKKDRKAAPKRTPRMSGKKRAVARTIPAAQAVQRARALNTLAWAHGTMELLLANFPEQHATFQPKPSDNHVLWTLGHLADTYYVYANMLDDKLREPPPEYVRMFGFGSTPIADPRAYPSLAEVRAEYNRAYEMLVHVVTQQTDADLSKPLHGDNSWLADSRLDAIHRMAHHEGWHQGQISAIRRALGLKSIF